MLLNFVAVSVLAAAASAATVTVKVSDSAGDLSFSPNSVTANIGDTVVFAFQGAGHSVAQGSGLDTACQPASNGFYSGFQSAPTTFSINITNTDAIWYYCSAPGHCQAGMAGVINPGSQSISTYQSNAKSASSNASPSGASNGQGGVLGTSSSSSTTSSTATASSASSSSTAKSAGSSTFQPSSFLALVAGLLVASW